jgi:Fuc2NAc and GlcNAc transferase
MDGIDGVAAIEAVTTCAGGLAIALLQHRSDAAWVVPALLGSASLGFLLWNFPPARIFMGDAGSGFLGLMLGVMAIDAARITPQSLWSWLILLAVFTTDATMTLIRRVQRGKKPHEAHRTHAYQHAAHDHRGHRQVSLAVAAINVGWLLPLALAVQLGRVDGLTGLIVASVPLVWLALRYGAGTDRAS